MTATAAAADFLMQLALTDDSDDEPRRLLLPLLFKWEGDEAGRAKSCLYVLLHKEIINH